MRVLLLAQPGLTEAPNCSKPSRVMYIKEIPNVGRERWPNCKQPQVTTECKLKFARMGAATSSLAAMLLLVRDSAGEQRFALSPISKRNTVRSVVRSSSANVVDAKHPSWRQSLIDVSRAGFLIHGPRNGAPQQCVPNLGNGDKMKTIAIHLQHGC